MATHTYTHSLGGRTVNIYFVHHAEVIRCEYKMVYYFHVRRIQNLLQMIMAQGFPAWAEEGISSATGVVRLILILVQNDRPEFDSRIGHHVKKSRRCACEQKAATVLPNHTAAT